jgi:type I restriction enzyme S subunit
MALLASELKLPPIGEIPITRLGGASETLCYTVKLSELSGRLDGSYHAPLAKAVEDHIRSHAKEVLTVGDARVSKQIILPGRFRRVYVGEDRGRVFIGGKQIGELDPSNKKYLSASGLSAKARSELEISENAILITRSGTIGRVAIAPRHWEKWMASEHIIRVIPADSGIAGFLHIFLASQYGHALGCVVNRFSPTR